MTSSFSIFKGLASFMKKKFAISWWVIYSVHLFFQFDYLIHDVLKFQLSGLQNSAHDDNLHFFFQQAHQKNQAKDSIDVDEPEGLLVYYICLLLSHLFYVIKSQLIFDSIEFGDPLTAEEQEEKEQLLEEVS